MCSNCTHASLCAASTFFALPTELPSGLLQHSRRVPGCRLQAPHDVLHAVVTSRRFEHPQRIHDFLMKARGMRCDRVSKWHKRTYLQPSWVECVVGCRMLCGASSPLPSAASTRHAMYSESAFRWRTERPTSCCSCTHARLDRCAVLGLCLKRPDPRLFVPFQEFHTCCFDPMCRLSPVGRHQQTQSGPERSASKRVCEQNTHFLSSFW